MLRHKWNNNDVCINCGIAREKRTRKTLMSIMPDNYKYEVKYLYFLDDSKETFERPECWRTTYED